MSIEDAYSIELEEIIDAERAYELFWDVKIKDKTAFNCICCNAKITCANLDKERAEMKNLPHFRCPSGHNENCDLIIGENNKNIGNRVGKQRSFINEDIDELKIIPNIIGVKKVSLNNLNEDIEEKSLKREKIIKEYKQGMRRKSKYTSIRPIISKYKKYKRDNLLKAKYINVYKDKNDSKKDINISYSDMFMGVAETNINKVNKYKRIYYGEGLIINVNNNYMVIFDTGFNEDNSNIKTTFFINLEEHLIPLNNFEQWKNRLDVICNNNEKIMIYIYTSKIKCKQYLDKSNKNKEVVNLILDNIGCFDYRKL